MSQAPKEISSAFFDAVKRLKYLNFIWKWDDGELPTDIPSNVFMQRWMPQQQILGNKRIVGLLIQSVYLMRLSLQLMPLIMTTLSVFIFISSPKN